MHRFHATSALGALSLGATLAGFALHPLQAQPASVEGSWQGALAPAPGVELRLVFHIHRDDTGELSATMDSPDQGAEGISVQHVVFAGDSLDLQLPELQARFRAALVHPDTLDGAWTQMGQTLPLVLQRVEGDTRPRRPQEPSPPFPYGAEEVRYPSPEAGIHLAGTLTLPEGPGPFPAVAMITGSGPQDRDETVMGHRPFLVVADHLTRRGIAVLRSDDRGVAASEGDFSTATSRDFAGDAAAAVAFLRERPEIDPDRVGLVGHSEGGMIAPMVAVDHGGVAFLVLLAGTALPGEEILTGQAEAIVEVYGGGAAAVEANRRLQDALFRVIREEDDEEAREARLTKVLRGYLDGVAPEERTALGIPEGAEDSWIASQAAMGGNPWFRYFLTHDPRVDLRHVRIPVLALFGELDVQVLPRPNMAAMEQALREAGNPDFTLVELPRLNHLFQTAETGAPTEYARIEETFSPEALELISEWIVERFGGPR